MQLGSQPRGVDREHDVDRDPSACGVWEYVSARISHEASASIPPSVSRTA